MHKLFLKKYTGINIPYRNFIFIPLFLTFFILLKIYGSISFPLTDFTGRPVSSATYNAFDISARVSGMYKGIFLLIILLLVFVRFFVRAFQNIHPSELKIANGISLGGFCLLFFGLTGADISGSVNLAFSLLIISFGGILFRFRYEKKEQDYFSVFLWSVTISTAIFFFVWQIMNFMHAGIFISLPAVCAITGTLLYLFFTFRKNLSEHIFKSTSPLIFIPLLSFISAECSMILNQHNHFISQRIIYLTGLLIILFFAFSKSRSRKAGSDHSSYSEIIFSRWIPLLILAITLISFYQPVVNPSVDWFEDANKVLPLQQWFSFGKIPFLDSFNSHLLADFAPGLVYSFFNGADSLGGYVYGFIVSALIILVVYYFILKITGNGLIALWLCLFYPYVSIFIPSYYNFIPLLALTLIMLYERQSAKRYFIFFITLIFMVFYRIDTGSSAIIASLISLGLITLFIPGFKTDRKNFLKGLISASSVLIVILIIAFIHSGSHLLIAVKDSLQYLSSAQSYGLSSVSDAADMKFYSLYFILPAVVILILIFHIYALMTARYSKQNSLYALAVVFLSVFYLANLQRGLVRHSLIEHWDAAFTSFGFFIIASAVYINSKSSNPFCRFFIFFISGTLITANYVYSAPDLKTSNYFSLLADKLKNFSLPDIHEKKIERIILNDDYKKQYSDLASWLNNNIPLTSTFLDFSNTPMLYYFTKRETPAYFDQIPHTAHNDYLQKRMIDDLKMYDIPVVLFANNPPGFWDNLDGIPNTFRHYRIAEYIYKNYKPAYTISGHSIWTRKNIRAEIKSTTVQNFGAGLVTHENITAGNDSVYTTSDAAGSLIIHPAKIAPDLKSTLIANISSSAERDISIFYDAVREENGEFIPGEQIIIYHINKGANNLKALLEKSFPKDDIFGIKITIPPHSQIKFSGLALNSSSVFPDVNGERPSSYSLGWIPFVWGSYDNNFINNKIIIQKPLLNTTENIFPEKSKTYSFDAGIDKSTGNYLMLSLRSDSSNSSPVMIEYGKDQQQNGSFAFLINPENKLHNYLIRMSSQYNWTNENNNWIRISSGKNYLVIDKIQILKGD